MTAGLPNARPRRPATAAVLLVLASLGAGSDAAAQSHYFDASLDFLHDDNVGRAEVDEDVLEDNIIALSGSLNVPQVLDSRSGLLHSLRLEYAAHTEWDDLSALTASAASTFRYQPGASFSAPWYEAQLVAALLQYRDSDIRDGAQLHLNLALGRNFTDRLVGRVSYRYELRRAWEGDVFDLDNHRFSGNLDYDIGERMTLYGTLAWQTGEVVSTATPRPQVLNASETWRLDEALSERPIAAIPVGGFYPGDRFAYRLDADTLTGELGINFAMSQSLALDLSALHFRAYGEGDNDYDGLLLRAGLLYRF
ncbi:MAG: hypothetical protein NFCOHLIN_01293 [Gammaproteobacteria bacterium]|nr:hypothetical protein [Gammaproteobacteria bacterium]